jgi:hypothetical protein
MAELNEDYKRRHGAVRSEKMKFHQGYYVPQRHPEKCLSATNIYRSSWELAFFDWCDRSESVLRWASEPISVEYRNPIAAMKYCEQYHLDWTNPIYWRPAKYFIDVWIELKEQNGNIRKIFIEIKPYDQSVAPKQPAPNAKLKEHKAYNRLALQYLQNQQKWTAAKKYCEDRGAEFMVITEVQMKKMGII